MLLRRFTQVYRAARAANGNSITKITPDTGVVGPSTFVGSEPNKMAISSDGQTLYTHLDGANSMRRFDVVSATPGLQFPTSTQPPIDMEVVPGSPQSIAFTRGRLRVGSRHLTTMRSSGRIRGTISSSVGAIEFGATASTLYGYSSNVIWSSFWSTRRALRNVIRLEI